MTTRRRLLGALASGSVAGVGGCLCDDTRQGPTARLEFDDQTRVGPVEQSWVIDGSIVARFLLTDDPSVGFHDVGVVVESEDGAVLGRTAVGDLERGDTTESTFCGWHSYRLSFRMRVDAFPYRLRLSAEEADRRCDDETGLDVEVGTAAFQDETYDVGHSGRLGRYWGVGVPPCPGGGSAE